MNKVKYGLSNVHYAKMTTGNDSTISFSTPVKIPGAVNLSVDPVGEISKFYADNITYYSSSTNGGYEGTIEAADTPKSFLTDILGYIEDSNGALIENVDAKTTSFALMYEVEGDAVNRRAVFYNCTVARPSTAAATTEDAKTPQTDTLKITVSARPDNKDVKAVIELSESNKVAFEAFYDKVYEKAAA